MRFYGGVPGVAWVWPYGMYQYYIVYLSWTDGKDIDRYQLYGLIQKREKKEKSISTIYNILLRPIRFFCFTSIKALVISGLNFDLLTEIAAIAEPIDS